MTGRDLIKGSLRLINAIGTGETPSAEEQSDGMSALNALLASMSIEGLVVFARVRELLTLVPNTASYTMGEGGTFDTPKPIEIVSAALEEQSSTPKAEIPLKLFTPREWAEVAQKSLTSTLPSGVYAERGGQFWTITLWPVPTVANKLVTYSKKNLLEVTNPSTEIHLPEGYERMIRSNLALELAPEYGKDPSARLIEMAWESKANVKRANEKIETLRCDPAIPGVRGGSFDWRTGEDC